MSKTTHRDKDEIIQIVKPFVDQEQPSDYKLVIKDAWFSDGLEAWIVAIDVDREGVSGTDFARRLVDIEEMVEKAIRDEKIEIHIHPTMYRED
jgi:hypothetical protein